MSERSARAGLGRLISRSIATSVYRVNARVVRMFFLARPSIAFPVHEKARSKREAYARITGKGGWDISQAIQARRARRAGVGRSRVGAAGGKADRESDEAHLGDSRRNALRRREDQRLDDGAVVDGASAPARAQRQVGSHPRQENQIAA